MGVLDRMMAKGSPSQSTPTQELSSIQAEVEYQSPDVVRRVNLVTDHFLNAMRTEGDTKMKRVARLLQAIVSEAMDDLNDVPAPLLEMYMAESAALVMWAATGRWIPGAPPPDGFVVPYDLLSPEERAAIELKPDPEEIDAAQRRLAIEG